MMRIIIMFFLLQTLLFKAVYMHVLMQGSLPLNYTLPMMCVVFVQCVSVCVCVCVREREIKMCAVYVKVTFSADRKSVV